jgi:hypothetical protein
MHQEPATPYKNKDPKSEENICNMPFSLKSTPQIDRQIHTPETTNSVDHVGWVDIHTSDPKVVWEFFLCSCYGLVHSSPVAYKKNGAQLIIFLR